MGEIFSNYVAQLASDGEPPDIETYKEICAELRLLLVAEIRRRGLWHLPTRYLGIAGASWDDDSLDELTSDAYVYIFGHRLLGLQRQLQVKGSIRPMVALNARHFLTDKQRQADPLGYRIFGRLKGAVLQNMEQGKVFVFNERKEAKEPQLSNASLIGFQSEPEPATVATRADLRESVRGWYDELLPELITAEGRAVPPIVKQLAEKVFQLRAENIAAFCFGDLAAELKDDVRRQWNSMWQQSLSILGQEAAESPLEFRVYVAADNQEQFGEVVSAFDRLLRSTGFEFELSE